MAIITKWQDTNMVSSHLIKLNSLDWKEQKMHISCNLSKVSLLAVFVLLCEAVHCLLRATSSPVLFPVASLTTDVIRPMSSKPLPLIQLLPASSQ